ncbi:MAG: L,D-transpeptidase, partial [Gammaproteobacteria bacterium]|nr:L,D-transpeptidase [Gammaproteobacteria bacterium]
MTSHLSVPNAFRSVANIEIDILSQRMAAFDGGGAPVMEAAVSTARNGVGEQMNSECTPRGDHIVRARIGAGLPANAVLVGRRPTGEIYSSELRRKFPNRDWILTRILWLSGLEPARNRMGNVDSMRRFIYIHGSPPDDVIGVPSSHGCIKLTNEDVIRL